MCCATPCAILVLTQAAARRPVPCSLFVAHSLIGSLLSPFALLPPPPPSAYPIHADTHTHTHTHTNTENTQYTHTYTQYARNHAVVRCGGARLARTRGPPLHRRQPHRRLLGEGGGGGDVGWGGAWGVGVWGLGEECCHVCPCVFECVTYMCACRSGLDSSDPHSLGTLLPHRSHPLQPLILPQLTLLPVLRTS